jgi:hypothetical protein
MLNLQLIRDRLGPNFRPFVIHVTDGRRFNVPHPDFIALGRGVVVVVDEQDSSHTLDALHIVSINETTPEQNPNGS